MLLSENGNPIQATVFDCDGVLVDSETINNEVFAELATEAGVPTTFADSVERFMGRSTSECVIEIEASLGHGLGFDFAAVYEERVLARVAELRAVPGVVELLEQLTSQELPVCVASSGTPTEIRERLAVTQLARYFGPHVYSASMVKHGKPAPDLFNYAAHHLGVPPSACALIEDSPYGVRGGRAAGMKVIGFAALASPESLRRAGADIVVRSMDQVKELMA